MTAPFTQQYYCSTAPVLTKLNYQLIQNHKWQYNIISYWNEWSTVITLNRLLKYPLRLVWRWREWEARLEYKIEYKYASGCTLFTATPKQIHHYRKTISIFVSQTFVDTMPKQSAPIETRFPGISFLNYNFYSHNWPIISQSVILPNFLAILWHMVPWELQYVG